MRKFLAGLWILLFLALPAPVQADIAPPAQPPGANLQPGAGVTEVRMESEQVVLEIQDSTPAASLGQARVTATFHMRNLGTTSESMLVRFPLGTNDGWGRFPEITEFEVKVDGKRVESHDVQGEDPSGYGEEVPWAAFEVTFKPNVEVIIEVEYTLEASGEFPFVDYAYIFSTGAGWMGTIGSVALFVRFPYEVSEMNVLPNESGSVVVDHQTQTNELRWVYTDLEPEITDNFKIQIVAPDAWQKVLRERLNVQNRPNDGEAWGRLGKIYKELAFSSRGKGFRYFDFTSDQGAQKLFALSVEAYQKALEYLPDDALWHAGYADLLGYYAHFTAFEGIDTRSEARQALEEIRTALLLAPDDEKVLEIADGLTWFFPDGITMEGVSPDFPWLTATPTLAPTEILSTLNTSRSTPTVQPPGPTTDIQMDATEAEPETDGFRLPICASIALAPLGLIFFLHRRK
jgi:hypothetical protein